MSPSTVAPHPLDPGFPPPATTGPEGEKISDLPEWTRRHFSRLILKPAQGYSGQGILVGFMIPNPEEAIQTALPRRLHRPIPGALGDLAGILSHVKTAPDRS